MELVILVWIVCGVIGAALAQSKDRSPLTGGLFGLILGPLGVLIVAFQSKLKPGETERAQTSIGKPVRYLMIGTGVLVALIVILAAVSSAFAGQTGLTVLASGHKHTSASKADAHGLYLRGYGRHLKLSYRLHCVSERYGAGEITTHTTSPRPIRSGQLKRLYAGNPYAPPTMSQGDCTITATLYGGGRLLLQILAS